MSLVIQSPPYFCAASETARYVAQKYAEKPVGTLPYHKFVEHYVQGEQFEQLPETGSDNIHYIIECFVDDYITLAIPTSQEQLMHVENAAMKGINDVFPAVADDE